LGGSTPNAPVATGLIPIFRILRYQHYLMKESSSNKRGLIVVIVIFGTIRHSIKTSYFLVYKAHWIIGRIKWSKT